MTLGSLIAGAAGGATVTIVVKAVDEASGTFKNINKNMATVGAAITGVGVAGALAIGSLASEAGRAQTVINAFNNMLGKNAPAALDRLKSATRGTVSEIDLMTQANQALLLGIDPDMLPSMFEGALAAAQATGRPVSDAIADITTGIGRQSKLILDNLGIIVNVDKAYNDYAETIGKAANELSDAERKTAFMNATMQALQSNAEKIGPIEEGLAIKSERMAAAWEDAKQRLGEQLIPVLELFVDKIVTPVSNFFEKHPTVAKWAAVIGVAGTALALVVGPLMIIVATLPAFIAGLTGVTIAGAPLWAVILGVTAAIAALVAIGYVVVKNWDTIKEKAQVLWEFFSKLFAPQIAILTLTVKALGLAFSWLWDNAIKPVWDNLVKVYNWIKDVFLGMLQKAIDLINKVASISSSIGGFISSVGSKILGTKQSGGPIYQTGPYLLHEGEYVLPKKEVGNQGTTINVSIGEVYGLNSDEISRALSNELATKIAL